MSFPDSSVQATFVTMVDPPDKLLHQAAAKLSDEEKSEQEVTILWPEQPTDEFL